MKISNGLLKGEQILISFKSFVQGMTTEFENMCQTYSAFNLTSQSRACVTHYGTLFIALAHLHDGNF